jgi:CDP-diacylglycerol--serine O-phosphatidyltransferase
MAKKKRRLSRRQRQKARRRAIYVLPNLVTASSLFAGFYSVIMAISGDFQLAAYAIIVSMVLDGLDGLVARATRSASAFGVQFDSLADLVAFGMAPGVLMFQWALSPFGRLGWLAAFLYVACGALRLARFNVQVDTVGGKHFVGLPIPAAAALLALTVLMLQELGLPGPVNHWSLVALVILLSFLMVSPVHYLSFKEMGISRLKSFNVLVAGLLFFTLVAIQPHVMGFLMACGYVVGGPWGAIIMARHRKATEKATEEESISEQITSA